MIEPKELNGLTADINDALVRRTGLAKAIPPRLYYRIRAWRKKLRPDLQERATRMATRKCEEVEAAATLSKSEAMASIYNSGELRFDFGSEVPEKVKKAAIDWAKRRGLKAVEASLNKSDGFPSSMLFVADSSRQYEGQCIRRVRWNCQ